MLGTGVNKYLFEHLAAKGLTVRHRGCRSNVIWCDLIAADGLVGLSGGSGAAAWDMAGLDAALAGNTSDSDNAASKKKGTTAEEFLGSNANLVNLNELVVRPPPSSESRIGTFTSNANFALRVILS